MENISETSAQRDSRRGDTLETPASESDSGDSLFFTQTVSSPSRTVKRHRPSFTSVCPLSQESEDEQEKSHNPNAQHEGARQRSDSDSETNYNDLLRKWRSLENTRGRINRQRRPRSRRATPKRMGLPFLSGFGLLPARKSQTIVNSEIGGFLKCVLKLSKGDGENRRRKLTPCVSSSEEEKTKSPLFSYGGMTFLKRKKGKKTKATEVSDNLPPIQVDLGQNEGSVPQVDDIECKKRKKVNNDGLLEESVATMTENSVPADPSLSPQDCSVVSALGNGNKPKKKSKKDKNGGLLEEVVDPMSEISISADSSISVQETSVVCSSFGGSKPKKKRKKDKCGQPMPQEDQLIDVEEAVQVPCQYSVSIAAETEQVISTDLFSPSIGHNVNQIDNNIPVNDLVESDGLEPRRKKKKKKMDSSLVTSAQMNIQQCSQESHSSLGTDTVKKKKKKFIHDVEEQLKEMAMDSYNHGEPLEKISEIAAGIAIQTVDSMGLKTDDSVTPMKKKKRKQEQVLREDNVDNEASLVEATEDMEILDTIHDSEQQAAELVLTSKVKKRKRKKERTGTTQEEETSKNACLSLGFGYVATPNSPSTRNEPGGIVDVDVPVSEPVKKKKKKKRRKELENDGLLSVCHDLEYLHQSPYHNTEQPTVENEASGSGDTENPSTCLETHSTNDSNEKKKLVSPAVTVAESRL
ncbi:titin [Clarias magur]|uniref:Titin n=1 Tax=Clarias magur TaxID=1594786 RepID=A0A8J4WZ71_CLAMG|nr:titin [Clarias magur]